MHTHINFTRVNKLETMYRSSHANVKLNIAQLSRIRVAFHTLPLFYLCAEILRAFPRKNYAKVEINPKTLSAGLVPVVQTGGLCYPEMAQLVSLILIRKIIWPVDV